MEIDQALDESEELWAGSLFLAQGQLDRPSSLEGWTIRDLINHVHGGSKRFQLHLENHRSDSPEMVATRSADFCSPSPLSVFMQLQATLRETIEATDVTQVIVHREGVSDVESLIKMRCLEMAVHAWDLCMSVQASEENHCAISSGLANWLLERIDVYRQISRYDQHFAPAPEQSFKAASTEVLRRTGRV